MAFRIHAFSGKERGLMVIGTAVDLRQLGQRLIDECRDAPDTEAVDWPRHVAEAPVSNATHFSLSFHLETRDGIKPKGSGLEGDLSKTVYLVLAAIGAISVVYWAARLVL